MPEGKVKFRNNQYVISKCYVDKQNIYNGANYL